MYLSQQYSDILKPALEWIWFYEMSHSYDAFSSLNCAQSSVELQE